MIDEKRLYDFIKRAIKEVVESEFEREIRPRLGEIDTMLEMLEDGLLVQIATERFAEIDSGTPTVSLEVMEKKYAL